MGHNLRHESDGYLKVARGGWGRPEKFTPPALFHLIALAVEGYWLSWLEERGSFPTHHAFRDLVRAAEAFTPLPADFKRDLLVLDQYQKLCEWIPIEPRQPTREDIPGLLALADRVAAFTDPTGNSSQRILD